jgi:uncharacterized protein
MIDPKGALMAAALLSALTLAGCSPDDSTPEVAPSPTTESSSTSARPSSSSTAPTAEAGPGTTPPTPLNSQRQQRLDVDLIAAAWKNDVPRARRLIGRGADVNTEDETVQSAFLIGASEGHLELLDLTLRHGADVNAKDSFNGTGLIRAAERGHWDVVGRLIQAGTPLNHVNNLGWTALHEAIILGDGDQRALDTVRVLVAAGADVKIRSQRDGLTAMQHATNRGYGEMADLLAAATATPPARGIDPGDARQNRTLLAAAREGNADAAALALRAGARLETRDGEGRTPLLLAVTHRRLLVARLLVALGANPDAPDDRHDTPWLVTGVTGEVEMTKLLLTADPDLTLRNRFGGISIIPASERGHVEYVRFVANTTNIDVNHVNDLGWTALLEAVILGDGSRPFQEIVRTLLEAGADPSIADNDGVTAFEHAQDRGQRTVATILRRAS